ASSRPRREKRVAGTRKIALFDNGESAMGGFWRNEPTLQERNRRPPGTIEGTAGSARGRFAFRRAGEAIDVPQSCGAETCQGGSKLRHIPSVIDGIGWLARPLGLASDVDLSPR